MVDVVVWLITVARATSRLIDQTVGYWIDIYSSLSAFVMLAIASPASGTTMGHTQSNIAFGKVFYGVQFAISALSMQSASLRYKQRCFIVCKSSRITLSWFRFVILISSLPCLCSINKSASFNWPALVTSLNFLLAFLCSIVGWIIILMYQTCRLRLCF